MPVFERILVATDYSDCSRAAVRQGAYIASAVNARLHVIHVLESVAEARLLEAYQPALDRSKLDRFLEDTSRELMRETLEEASIAEDDVAVGHLYGHRIADAILEYAERQSIDLIVVGTHGHRGLRRLLLGSVARAIVAAASAPTLVARNAPQGSGPPVVRRIMAPVDLSENSAGGLEAARSLASVFHSPMEVVHVLERYVVPVSLSEIKTARHLVPDVDARVRMAIKDRIGGLEGPFVPYSIHVREGDPATTIVDMAEELGCDLIVVTRRGLSASARFLVGSVTEKVLQAAHCSVLVEPASDSRG